MVGHVMVKRMAAERVPRVLSLVFSKSNGFNLELFFAAFGASRRLNSEQKNG